jgi:hypothetical protein
VRRRRIYQTEIAHTQNTKKEKKIKSNEKDITKERGWDHSFFVALLIKTLMTFVKDKSSNHVIRTWHYTTKLYSNDKNPSLSQLINYAAQIKGEKTGPSDCSLWLVQNKIKQKQKENGGRRLP